MKELVLKNGMKITVDCNTVPFVNEGVMEIYDVEGNFWLIPLANIECYFRGKK